MNDLQKYRDATIRTAQYLAYHGIRVFPAIYSSKQPLIPKEDWAVYATNNMTQFADLIVKHAGNKPYNLAIVFGPQSGICDVEPDDKEAVELLEGFIKEAGVRTIAYKSRRGTHYLFKWEPRLAVFQKNNVKVKALECRLGISNFGGKEGRDGGQYSIAPPSLHPDTGEYYAWLPGCAPWEVAPAPMPENLIQYFEINYRKRLGGMEVEVISDGDGFLPGEGNRHTWLLQWSKSLYTSWMLPMEDCVELTRIMSQRIGSYQLEGRGELELKNLFKYLRRPVDPAKEMTASIRSEDINDAIDSIRVMQREEAAGMTPELPTHIYPKVIEEASQHARAAQYPRNLFLHTILSSVCFALGSAVRVRASINHDPTGLQMFSFGVGASGTGKSKVTRAVLVPVSHSDALTTEGSPEGLVSKMARYPRGVMLEFTEGKDFYTMLGKYSASGATDNSLFHKCWSGDKIRRTLQRGTVVVDNPFLVVSAAIQPYNLNHMPVNDCLDGLLQRMLVYPIGNVPRKEDAVALASFQEFMSKTWPAIVQRLFSVKASYGTFSMPGHEVRPTEMILTPEAFAVWRDYAAMKRSEQTMAMYPEDHPHRSDLVRHAEIVLRFSGAMTFLECSCDGDFWDRHQVSHQDWIWISKEMIERVIDHMEWDWQQKIRLVDHLVESAFATISGTGLKREETVVDRMDKHVTDRRRRIEGRVGEEWTLKQYYDVFKLKKRDAQSEVDLFVREGHVVALPLKEGQQALRYKFLEAVNE